jgi:cyclopropane fatty-acyl-phospholipid synthase-like methyltransferase
MLARAREQFPAVRYEKLGLQEMNFHETFDGIICMDAMEHICPEDYPMILRGFQKALKPDGVLYFTVDRAEAADFDLEAYYERAKAMGLPVVFGEVADEAAYQSAMEQPEVSGKQADIAVYHYYPPLEKVHEWIAQAGLAIEEEGAGSGVHHFVVKKERDNKL